MSGAAAGAAIVGIAALIAGWKIKAKDVKKRLEQAYHSGYATGAHEKQNELQPTITGLQNNNTQLTNTVASKEREIASKNIQLAAKDQEISTLKAEIEKLKPKDNKKQDEKKE